MNYPSNRDTCPKNKNKYKRVQFKQAQIPHTKDSKLEAPCLDKLYAMWLAAQGIQEMGLDKVLARSNRFMHSRIEFPGAFFNSTNLAYSHRWVSLGKNIVITAKFIAVRPLNKARISTSTNPLF